MVSDLSTYNVYIVRLFQCKFCKNHLFHLIKFVAVIKSGEKDNFPVAVNNYISGHAGFLLGEKTKYICTRIKSQRVRDCNIFFKLNNFINRFIPVNTNNNQTIVFLLQPYFLFNKGHFFTANTAPACSKLKHNYFPLKIREFI